MGTGGGDPACLAATRHAKKDTVLVLNGDTFFRIRLDDLSDSLHEDRERADYFVPATHAGALTALGWSSWGDDQRSVTRFRESSTMPTGLINGGVYALDRERFLQEDLPPKFSFEKDYLEKFYTRRNPPFFRTGAGRLLYRHRRSRKTYRAGCRWQNEQLTDNL